MAILITHSRKMALQKKHLEEGMQVLLKVDLPHKNKRRRKRRRKRRKCKKREKKR
jgi:hypothetical protein